MKKRKKRQICGVNPSIKIEKTADGRWVVRPIYSEADSVSCCSNNDAVRLAREFTKERRERHGK